MVTTLAAVLQQKQGPLVRVAAQLLRLRRHLLQLRVMLHLLTMEEAGALEQQELLEMVYMTILLLALQVIRVIQALTSATLDLHRPSHLEMHPQPRVGITPQRHLLQGALELRALYLPRPQLALTTQEQDL